MSVRHIMAIAAVAFAAGAAPAAAACRSDIDQVVTVARQITSGASAGDAGDLVWSDDCTKIYIANRVQNRIEVLSLATLAWESPIPARAAPRGMDITADGRFLYVANEGDGSISEITLATGAERRIPVSAGAPQDLVVAANGKVLVIGAGGITKLDPATGTAAAVGSGVSLTRSGDRRLVTWTGPNAWSPTYRYWADSDAVGTIETIGPFALNGTGSVGLVRDFAVRDFRTSSGTLRGDIPYTNTTTRGLMVDHAGTFAYDINNTTNTSDFAFIDVIDLTTFQRLRRIPTSVAMEIPPGPERYFGVSPDDSLVAFVGGNALVIARTDREAASNDVSVFSLRFANIYSLLRFHNQGTQAGKARVTLHNYDTGEVMHRWESPPIAPGSAPQFYIRDMEMASGLPFERPFKYIASFEADFPGTAAHVTWYPGGPIADASTCRSNVTGSGRSVANVHSSRIGGDYPSEIGVLNTGASAAPLTLAVRNAHNGLLVARYDGGQLPAGASRTIAMTEIELAAGILPGPDLTHYVVELEGPMEGRMQHLVFHRPSQVLADMSAVCRL